MLNLEDVRVTYCRHPISDATKAEMINKAEETFEFASQAITTNAPIATPDWVNGSKDVSCST